MSERDERYPVHAPGWAAIDRALEQIHPGQVPHQFTSQTAYELESPNPLPAIGVYEGRAPDHWLYVTYGLTELFEKSSAEASVSGFGFELTLRLPRDASETRPPGWALALLQGIGGYILRDGHGLDSGHLVDLGGPIVPSGTVGGEAAPTALEGLLCLPDAMLGKIHTPHGTVLFVQLFGLTRAELDTMQSWPLDRKVGLVRELDALAIVRPDRVDLRADPRTAPLFRRYELGVLL